MFLEMSRDPEHGGAGWEFSTCLWAPTTKKIGGAWPFWTKVGHIEKGALILHLRGINPNAEFKGFSVAASDGYTRAIDHRFCVSGISQQSFSVSTLRTIILSRRLFRSHQSFELGMMSFVSTSRQTRTYRKLRDRICSM